MKTPASIDSHIASLPVNVQKMVESIRDLVHTSVPEAQECIKYGIPTFTLYGKNLVHFAGYATHIGFYPAPSGIDAFKEELAPYFSGKGTLRFSLDKPLPLDLIRRIVLFRVSENLKKK